MALLTWLEQRIPRCAWNDNAAAARVKPWAGFALLVLIIAGSTALSGCLQADSLGDEPPDEVHVGTPPRWDNGVQELMALKCAVCHQVPRTEVSPNNVPDTFDLRYQTSSPTGFPGATAILSALTGGVLRGQYPGVPRMPLPYATPLTERERVALETWATNGGP